MRYLSTNVTPSYLAAAVSQFLSILHTHGFFVNLQTVAVSAFKLYFLPTSCQNLSSACSWMSELPLCIFFFFFSFLHSSTVLLISLCLTIGSIALVASHATVGLQSLPEFRFMSSSTWLRTQSATCHWSKQHLWWSLCHPPRNSPAEHYLQHLVPCCRLAHPSTLHRVTHSVTLLRLRAGEERVCLSAESKVNKKQNKEKLSHGFYQPPWLACAYLCFLKVTISVPLSKLHLSTHEDWWLICSFNCHWSSVLCLKTAGAAAY